VNGHAPRKSPYGKFGPALLIHHAPILEKLSASICTMLKIITSVDYISEGDLTEDTRLV
jgi:hypothetical protein